MMPLHIVLVRHGQSEGNLTIDRSKKGDDSAFTPEFLARHGAHLRLTARGREQAAAVGAWLRESGFRSFDRYFVSEYTRAMETAALLGLPDAIWDVDNQLTELDHGLVDVVPDQVKRTRFAEWVKQRKKHLFFGRWPEGESIAMVCNRLRGNIIATLERECERKRVIIVSHGDIMRSLRVIFEGISANEYHRIDSEDPSEYKIGNGQVIHYTRQNPEDPEDIRPKLRWVRSLNPWNPPYAGHPWREITSRWFSNRDLLGLVERDAKLIEE